MKELKRWPSQALWWTKRTKATQHLNDPKNQSMAFLPFNFLLWPTYTQHYDPMQSHNTTQGLDNNEITSSRKPQAHKQTEQMPDIHSWHACWHEHKMLTFVKWISDPPASQQRSSSRLIRLIHGGEKQPQHGEGPHRIIFPFTKPSWRDMIRLLAGECFHKMLHEYQVTESVHGRNSRAKRKSRPGTVGLNVPRYRNRCCVGCMS